MCRKAFGSLVHTGLDGLENLQLMRREASIVVPQLQHADLRTCTL